ncbi:hypothetical protein HaloA020_22860 [Halomonas sp. A020]|uniref:hypothetical protein n=1 Tax=Halomonas sp. A020 TaxID=2717374 RepID=UPI00249236F4|nr:hypothetical protein [Halomonas sp. A020]BCB61585.1 hypothetical protein HaloA020_22860 [Halomonas sp. A020]
MSKKLDINSYERTSDILEIVDTQTPTAVNANNFVALIGDYRLKDSEPHLKCFCEKKKKDICGQNHRNGYVVELTDGIKSLLGSTCVKDFDPEGELRKSVAHYDNQKRFFERVGYVNDCFYDKGKIVKKLEVEAQQIGCVNKYVSDLVKSLPSGAVSKLQEMAKSGRRSIAVDVRKVVEEKNEVTGKVEKDVSILTHTLGEIQGLSVFNHAYRLSLLDELKKKIDLINRLEYTKHDSSARSVAKLHNELLEIDPLCERVRNYCSEKILFERSNTKFFIYLTSDHSERVQLYRMWSFNKFEAPVSPSTAAQKILEADSEIIEQFNATNLIIAA